MVLLEVVKNNLVKKYSSFDYEIDGKICYFLYNGFRINFSCATFDPMDTPPEGIIYYYHKPSPCIFIEDYEKLKELLEDAL